MQGSRDASGFRDPVRQALSGRLGHVTNGAANGTSIRSTAARGDGAQAREKRMLDAMRAPIFITGPDGTITDCNLAACALLGPRPHIVGRPIHAVIPFIPESSQDDVHGRTWVGRLEHMGNQTIDVEVTQTSLSPLAQCHDQLFVLQDISQHAELNRLREQLLYSVAHELRAPMAVLENTLDLAASEYGAMSAQEFDQLMRSAKHTAMRLRALMEDLLSAGNIQSGRFVVSARPVALSELIDGAVDTVRVLLVERDQQVQWAIGTGAKVVLADPRYVRQVLSNLLANASKYGPRARPIQVIANRQANEVRITVADEGPGIPTEQQAGLFDRFYRVRPGNEEPGIGLGLAIVKGIVTAHGGTVGVDSEPGAGTRVWFTLPRASFAKRSRRNEIRED